MVSMVVIMSAGALSMAGVGESGVISKPGAGPGIREDLLVERGVVGVALVPSIPGPHHYLIPTLLGLWSWVRHARD